MKEYYPEGEKSRHIGKINSLNEVEEYIENEIITEGLCVLCDIEHNLIVDLGFIKGIIPREEGAIGIDDGSTRDIALISRVNKPVSFIINKLKKSDDGVYYLILSRKKAQLKCRDNFISNLKCGDIIDAKITHLEQFGAFVDIGCGVPSLIPIDHISVSRISHPMERFYVGQNIKAVVRSIENGRITLSHKELLGTWKQNADKFNVGETVTGIVRSIENYGIFVELKANLAGLAEIRQGVSVNSKVSVYIKAIIPEKMKIKLIIVDVFDSSDNDKPPENEYYISEGNIKSWKYSTDTSKKLVMTDF